MSQSEVNVSDEFRPNFEPRVGIVLRNANGGGMCTGPGDCLTLTPRPSTMNGLDPLSAYTQYKFLAKMTYLRFCPTFTLHIL